jgi:S1-C subfamily serine protease
MTTLHFIKSSVVCFLLAAAAHSQSAASRNPSGAAVVKSDAPVSSNILRELDSSIENVVDKVSPAVVQIVVAGYAPAESHGST